MIDHPVVRAGLWQGAARACIGDPGAFDHQRLFGFGARLEAREQPAALQDGSHYGSTFSARFSMAAITSAVRSEITLWPQPPSRVMSAPGNIGASSARH